MVTKWYQAYVEYHGGTIVSYVLEERDELAAMNTVLQCCRTARQAACNKLTILAVKVAETTAPSSLNERGEQV